MIFCFAFQFCGCALGRGGLQGIDLDGKLCGECAVQLLEHLAERSMASIPALQGQGKGFACRFRRLVWR